LKSGIFLVVFKQRDRGKQTNYDDEKSSAEQNLSEKFGLAFNLDFGTEKFQFSCNYPVLDSERPKYKLCEDFCNEIDRRPRLYVRA
jgi:hypothetical protein